jgi:hypothetical protein
VTIPAALARLTCKKYDQAQFCKMIVEEKRRGAGANFYSTEKWGNPFYIYKALFKKKH